MAFHLFEQALKLTLQFEGGYSDHPLDPGGATKFGITRATLRAHRGRPVSKAEIMALSRDEAALIYRKSFWDAIDGDRLPAGLDICLFDFAVNSGPSRAAATLQRHLGLKPDGGIGERALAVAAAHETASLIRTICASRLGFLNSLRGFATFGRGWARRVGAVQCAALAAASRPHPGVPHTTDAPTSHAPMSQTLTSHALSPIPKRRFT